MEYWIIYDLASGEELWRGSGPAGSAVAQALPEGAGLIGVPQSVVASATLNLDQLRDALKNGIDAAAEQVRSRFMTPGAGQGLTYLVKEDEARAWLIDPTTPTPFLSMEATLCGTTVEAVAAEVIANADAWKPIGATIEGMRRAGKQAVQGATTLGAIVAAAQVDWSVFVAPAD